MRRVQISRNKVVLLSECRLADGFFSRLRGLIGSSESQVSQGLLLRPCREIHMWAMEHAIDVVFLHGDSKSEIRTVGKIFCQLKPWKLFPVRDGNAYEVLEVSEGWVSRNQIQEGDTLCIS